MSPEPLPERSSSSLIVVSEAILEEALNDCTGVRVHYDPHLYERPHDLAQLLEEADALIVRNQTSVDRALIENARRLKVVGRHGVGLDNLDMGALKERGILVTWTPGANAASVAEYVIGAALQLSRRYAQSTGELRSGRWDRSAAVGSELFGKYLGIIGLGDIGSRLAKRAHAFGMRLLAHDPVHSAHHFAPQEYGVQLLPLETLLKRSDVVSLHAPLTAGTRHLICEATLSLMKPSAYLINTARGGLINEADLAHALQSGQLAGAALDVREHEPPRDALFSGLESVILTPHIAGVTHEANRRVAFHVVQDVLRVLAGQAPLSRAPGSV